MHCDLDFDLRRNATRTLETSRGNVYLTNEYLPNSEWPKQKVKYLKYVHIVEVWKNAFFMWELKRK